ncbi:MAG: hypothetical protein Q4E35_04515 [Eubacteriales bacterium]|nr:hypothetical protein [Eubacteriales bacterium]
MKMIILRYSIIMAVKGKAAVTEQTEKLTYRFELIKDISGSIRQKSAERKWLIHKQKQEAAGRTGNWKHRQQNTTVQSS